MKTTVLLKRTRFIVSLLLFIFINTSYAKNKVTITVVEKETGTRIPFAVVSIVGKANNKPVGMTDLSGVLTTVDIEHGQKIAVSSLGYSPCELSITEKNNNYTIELKKGVELKEVVIVGKSVPLISCGISCGYIVLECPADLIHVSDQKVFPEVLKNNSNKVSIYPNPARSVTRVSTGLENYLLEIFDCTGKLVLSFENMNDDQSIDIEKLKAGVYFCRISKDNFIQTSRLVVN
ncbi:MAG: T9SS type A sorting domain-containing protein [Bacteroidia bacterium]|nr:T9SS type A sorting domain-containing protein [Bacteroidota bacterium]MBP6657527.1 T9SS type A sorting domain-containing protein [Bacteroidia bacterium]